MERYPASAPARRELQGEAPATELELQGGSSAHEATERSYEPIQEGLGYRRGEEGPI